MERHAEYRYKNIEEYRKKLKNSPTNDMIKTRSMGGGKTGSYLPIATQEAFADLFFREWNIIEENYFVIENEICATVKIQYLPDYPGADFQFATGSAANTIQMSSKSKPIDYPKNKITNALEYCLPGVRSSAKSNALEGIGNIFGRNVSRGDVSNDYAIRIVNQKES